MVQSSRYMSSLAIALGSLEYALVGRVTNPEPLTAEHEVVDAVPDFRRQGENGAGCGVALHAVYDLAYVFLLAERWTRWLFCTLLFEEPARRVPEC